MTLRDPQTVCDEECAAFPQRAPRLRRMHRICAARLADGHKDFSIDAVARACAAQGDAGEASGPTAGAIRNPDGAPYRRLIDAFVREAGGGPQRRRKGRGRARDDDLRHAPRSLRDEMAALEQRCARLAMALKMAQADAKRASGLEQQDDTRSAIRLAAPAMRELCDAWSETSLRRRGWRVVNGRVTDEAGRTVFRPGMHAFWGQLTQAIEPLAVDEEVELRIGVRHGASFGPQ